MYIITINILVHGACSGADTLADRWAKRNEVTVVQYAADWAVHGRAAGPIRNRDMARCGADLCIAFAGGKGTANMIAEATAAGIPVRRET
jgi:predicted polyphosphate/ATP-dependent NAD kinase